MHKQAKHFISCCLRKNPYKRWNIAKLLKHPFLNLDKINLTEVKKEDPDINRIIQEICSSTFIKNIKDEQSQNNKDTEINSINHHNSTQSPKSVVQTEKKVVSLSELQAKFLELKIRDIVKHKNNEGETPKYYSQQPGQQDLRFNFSAEVPNNNEF